MSGGPEEIDVVRWRRVAGIVEVALELDRATRAAYLETLGRQDEDLRRRVFAILRSMGVVQSGDELAQGDAVPSEPTEDTIGPWRIVRLLGRGGMGTVFLAERADDEYERQVAIKVIGIDSGAPVVHQRFLSERQILAGFDHANIAKLFDAGTNRDGRPYLAMEYIDGLPIDEYCFANELGIKARLELFKKVCAAVSYAHRNLVVHRDLKPSNILVTSDGEPKLLDFGIAKLLDPESFPIELEQTRTAHRPMTPNWASPEQLNREPISTSTDVYSLGLVLFKMLTGALPSRGAFRSLGAPSGDTGDLSDRPSRLLARSSGENEMLFWPADQKPHAIRRLRGDLDNIIMKALRTEPNRRYPSVESLSDDLDRFLEGRPVSATRDTPLYIFRKLASRYRWQLTAAVVFVFAIISVAGVALHQAEQVRRERDQTVFAREQAERQAALAEKQAALAEKQAKRAEGSLQFLSDLLRAADETERLQQDLSVRDLLSEGLGRLESGEVTAPEAKMELLELIADAFKDFRDLPSAVHAQELAYDTAVASDLPEQDRLRLLADLAFLQIAQGDQSQVRETCGTILRSSAPAGIRLSCLEALEILASFEGNLREQVRLSHLILEGVAQQDQPGEGFSELIGVTQLRRSGLLSAEEAASLLEAVCRMALHELSPEAAHGILQVAASSLAFFLPDRGDKQTASLVIAWLENHLPASHQHDTVAGNRLLSIAWTYRWQGRFDEAMAILDKVESIGRRMVELDPGHLRGRWLLAAVSSRRGRVWQELGQENQARGEFEKALAGFRGLYEMSGENFFIQRDFSTALMEAGHGDEARPIVQALIEKGLRQSGFLELAEQRGLLPDPMPPDVEFELVIPPSIQARFDAARHIRLPWEPQPSEGPGQDSEDRP